MKPTILVCMTALTLCNILTIYFLKKLSIVFISEHSFREFYYILSFKEFYLAAFAGAGSVALYIYVNAQIELSRFVPILTGMVTLIASSMGIVLFREALTVNKVIGLLAILFALVLLSK